MAVRPTMSQFPENPKRKEACVLPWGVTLTPFAAKDENGVPPVYGSGGELLPRCIKCSAYYNTCCAQYQSMWLCLLCGSINYLSPESIARYAVPNSSPANKSSFVDLELPLEESEEMQARPMYIAAIDLTSSKEFLELTKSALLAALEALGPGSLFGLATFSHKIGLYDVQGPIPVVKNVFIPPDGNLAMELEDVMPLFSFLAPVDTCKDRIVSALETLKPTSSWERTIAVGQGVDDVLLGGRGFGVAMKALLEYIGSEYGNTYALARVFAFLSGAPDYGLGQLDTRRYGEQYASKREDADCDLLHEQTPFYRDLAAVAVQDGVCVDIFAVTNHEYTDLASLKFLSIDSGGSLFLYSKTDDSTLPQDMYHMLSQPYAFNCVLRARTSSNFKLRHSYGHFSPDPEYENVQHIVCCDSFATYAYDFDFTSRAGLPGFPYAPALQIAFQYSVVVPLDEPSVPGSSPSQRARYSLKRRLRIRTLKFMTARTIRESFRSVDPEAVLSMLVHEVISSSLENGVQECRSLLHEWLVNLTTQYNDAHGIGYHRRNEYWTPPSYDVTFYNSPRLQPLPRFIFALLQSPLLRSHEEGVHPDYQIYLQCLFSSLEPTSLALAVYPHLVSFDTPDEQAFSEHFLSRSALITSVRPIYFLDAFTTLVVFYSSTADAELPLPPPQDCLLTTAINKLKRERVIIPKLIFIRGGKDDAAPFENYLIEEVDVEGSSSESVVGFVSFLGKVSRGVAGIRWMRSLAEVDFMSKSSRRV